MTSHPRTPKFSTNIYQVTLSHKAPSSSEAVPHPLLYLIGERGAHSPPFKDLKKDSQRGGAAARPGANGFEAAPRRRSFFTAAPALCSALKALRLLLSTSGPLQGRREEQEEKGEPPVRTGQASPAGCGSGKRRGKGAVRAHLHAQGRARHRHGAKREDTPGPPVWETSARSPSRSPENSRVQVWLLSVCMCRCTCVRERGKVRQVREVRRSQPGNNCWRLLTSR